MRASRQNQAESFRKMMLAMVQDIRVIIIKLSDRLHNMRTIYALEPQKQMKKAKETLEIFAPIANRLGIYNIRRELEKEGFKYGYPYRHKIISSLKEETWQSKENSKANQPKNIKTS